MSEHDNANLGVCGLCGGDRQALEREIERLRKVLENRRKERAGLIVALHETIRSPLGVVPDSALPWLEEK